jgi:hypothetical protein
VLAAVMILGVVTAADAELAAVDPGPYLAAYGFYPAWYQDTTGKQLELCLSKTVSPNVAPTVPPSYMCLLALPDDNAPIVFPLNFGDESFWFTADALIDNAQGLRMLLVQAVEAAFSVGPVVDGDQISFARIRIRIDVPQPGGVYTITTPYATFRCGDTCVPAGSPDPAPAPPGDRGINFTEDIGIRAPGVFVGALFGRIGPFLQAADAPGGTPTPTFIAATGETFIGDPNIDQFVTGSPFGNNFFRVEGPGIGSLTPEAPSFSCGTDCIQTSMFAVSGKVFDGVLPTAVTVDRSTYSRTALGDSRIDVFATSTSSASLSFRDKLVGGVLTAMTPDGGKFYGRQLNPGAPPANVIVRADDPSNPTGGTRPAEVASRLVDEVKITRAAWARDTGTLLIEATSSDRFAPLPRLTVVGLGCPTPADPCVLESAVGGVTNTLNVPGVVAPPARITVISSQGGSDTEPVQIVPTINNAPVAANDTASTTQGVPVVINVVGNDTDLGGAIDPTSVVIVAQPAGGTAECVAPCAGQVTYTPNATFFGTDTFRYTVADNTGARSNEATVTVRVNGLPIAVNDSASSAGLAVNINVLGNDTDPDGNTPLTVANLTQPAAGTGSAALANNTVTYTPAVGFTGSATFTYQARDSLGALSNIATVTVTVTAVQNQPPVAQNDSATTRVGTPVNIAVLANDTDPEGNLPLVVVNLTQPANGSAALQANNTVTYTPNVGFPGLTTQTDTFTYQARDSLGAVSNVATVTVTVTPETITVATAQARVRNGRADWTVNGTTNVINGNQGPNFITVRLVRTGQIIGQPVPDNRGRWKLSARNTIVPVAGDQIAVTSRYTTTPLLVTVTIR